MNFDNINPKIMALLAIPAFCFVIYVLHISSYNYQNKERLEKNIKNSFHGIIEEKYLEKHNRNAPFIKFKNSKTEYLEQKIWDKVKIGDSLNKKSGDSLLFVYRKKDIIKFNYKDIFYHYDSINKANP